MYEKKTNFGLSSKYIKGVVYLYTNKINGKVYIGETIDEEGRKASHKLALENFPFHNAIRKYGWSNFEYKVLFRTSTKIQYSITGNSKDSYNNAKKRIKIILWEIERYYIKKYDSVNKEKGYNVTEGGGLLGKRNCIEILLLDLQGNIKQEFDSIIEASKLTGISIGVISRKHRKNNFIDKNGNVWMTKKEYYDNKSIFPLDYCWNSSKIVLKFSMKGILLSEYKTVTEAANNLPDSIKDSINRRKAYIRHVCTGLPYNGRILVSKYGFRWAYKSDYLNGKANLHLETVKDLLIPGKIENKNFKKIVQLSTKGEFINKFKSISTAVNILKEEGIIISISAISKCCKGENKTAANFIWMFEEDYNKLSSEKSDVIPKYKNKWNRSVIMTTLENKYEKKFESIAEALKYINNISKSNGSHSYLTRCCDNPTEHIYKNHRWFWEDDWNKLSNKLNNND